MSMPPCDKRKHGSAHAVLPSLQPLDFMFQLTADEWENVEITICDFKGQARRAALYALRLTEQGVAMLSSVLNSPRAIAVNIEIMRAFVRLREMNQKGVGVIKY